VPQSSALLACSALLYSFSPPLVNEPFASRKLLADDVFIVVVIHGAVFVYLAPSEVNVITLWQHINVGDVSIMWVDDLYPVGKEFGMAGLDGAAFGV
jgi:hypothetical protein